MTCTQMNEQGSLLHCYISRWNFVSTHLQLQSDGPSYTYESEAHSTLSTLDPILCPAYMFQSAYTIVDEPLNTSDHNPVIAVLHHDFSSPTHPPLTIPCPVIPRKWSSTSMADICCLYTKPLQKSLVYFLCKLPSSPVSRNPNLIDNLFQSLTSIHIRATTFHPHRSPGWNSTLKHANRECKIRYHNWVHAGRPRDIFHPVRKANKEAKQHFRPCLRLHCKSLSENFFSSLDAHTTTPHRFFQTIGRHTSSNSSPSAFNT